jgi:phage-related protein
MSNIKLIIDAQDRATPTLKKINKQVDRFDRKGRKGTKSALGFGTALKAAGAAAAAIGFAKLVTGIVSTNAMFESLRASLKTVTGSLDGARVAMHQIEEFTKSTPFQLEEVANSFIILKRMGIDTTTESLKAFGNIAAANGKSFEQLAEAVADAMTGEFERLKEFGIKVKQENGKFIASMGSTQIAVSESAEAMVNELKALGEDGGRYASGLADQAATMGGKFSNLKDNMASFAKGIGEGGLNTALKEVLDSFNGLFKGTGDLASQIGAGLGAAIITIMKKFKGLVTLVQEIGKVILNFGRNAKNDVADNFQRMKNRIGSILAGILGKFGTSFEEIAGTVKRILNFVVNVFRAWYEQVWNIITNLPEAFSDIFQGIGRLAIDFGNRLATQFKNIGSSLLMAFKAGFNLFDDKSFAEALAENFENAFSDFKLSDAFDLDEDIFLTSERIKEIFGQDGFAEVKKFITGASEEVIAKLKVLGINISNLQTPGEALNDFMDTYNRLLQEGADEQEALNKALAANSAQLDNNSTSQNSNNKSKKTGLTLLEKTKKAYDDLLKVVTKTTDQDLINRDLLPMINKAYEEGTLNVEQYSEALNKIGSSYSPLEVSSLRTIDTIKKGFAGMAGSITDTFYDMFSGVTSVFDGLRSIAASVFQMIAKAVIQTMIVKPILAMMGIPMFAQGGLAPSGRPAIVGENGPELIVPSSNTRVFSSSQTSGMLGGASQEEPLTVNFNLNAVSTRDGVEFLIENKNTITNVIQDAYQTRGRSGPLG